MENKIDQLPLIELEDFEKKVQEQAEKLWVLKKLLSEGATWDTLPPHLRDDLFMRIGARPIVNKY